MKRDAKFRFLLYIADHSQNSERAIANLTALCQTYLPDRHDIEVVDVIKVPKRALADGVLMTPMLIKLAPSPVKRIVGTLSNAQIVLDSLGLETNGAGEPQRVLKAPRLKPSAA